MKKLTAVLLSLCLLMGVCFGTAVTASAEEITADTVVTADMVPDALLYEAMVESVWMMSDDVDRPETITCGEVAQIYDLDIYSYDDEDVTLSLKGLELCVSLEWLYVDSVTLADGALDEVAKLTNLTELSLTYCGITDWSVLAALQNLEVLDLSGNYITDLSPVDAFGDNVPMMIVTDNRLDMSDTDTVAYVEKLVAAAEAKVPEMLENGGLELEEMLIALEEMGIALDVEAAVKAMLPMMINGSQLPKDGELIMEDSVSLYVQPFPFEELLETMELPEGTDVSGLNDLLYLTVNGEKQSFSETPFTVSGKGKHEIGMALNVDALLPLMDDMLAAVRENEELHTMLLEMLAGMSAAPDLDMYTDDELFELLFTVDENGYVYTYFEVPMTDMDGNPIYEEDVMLDGTVITIDGDTTDMREVAEELYGDAVDDIADEDLFDLFFYYDGDGALILTMNEPFLDEDGNLLTKADMLDENGNLTIYGESMPIREYAEYMLTDETDALFPMDEDGNLLDENGEVVLDEGGNPVKAIDAALDMIEEELPAMLEMVNETMQESPIVTFYLQEYGVKKGDTNQDARIDSSDARIVLQVAVGKIALDETEVMAADVNNDTRIDSSDARMILQYSVGKITHF